MAKAKKIEDMTHDELVVLATEQADKIASQEKSLDEKDKVIGDLNKELTDALKNVGKEKVLIVSGSDKTKYQVIGNSKYNGKLITFKELNADSKLVDELVELGSGQLKEIKS